MNKKKLYNLVSNFKIYDYYSYRSKQIRTLKIDNCPIVHYPDNTPCFEANSYLLHLLFKGLSQNNGGTLETYASAISLLIRYCYLNKIQRISTLDNDEFVDFINFLKLEKSKTGKFIRRSNQIIMIGQRCIEFLIYVQDLYNLKNFIGIGSQYRIRLISKITLEYRSKTKVTICTHSSLPHKVPSLKKRPISKDHAIKIRQFVSSNTDESLRSRNLCILDCIELTGARRDEIRSLKVQDIVDALQTKDQYPSLRLITLKTKRNDSYRLVPVPRTLLNNLSIYIRRHRRRIIQKSIGTNSDHGYVFISHTSGHPLSVDTFTTYMHEWASGAHIDSKVSLHQFRHKFITEKIIYLIQEFQIENKYKFREAFLEIDKLKLIVQQWTGHKSIKSLDTYIDYAFLEEKNIDALIDKVLTKTSIFSITEKIKELENSYLEEKITKDFFLDNLRKTVMDYSSLLSSSDE